MGHDKPGLAAQAEQSGLAVLQVRQLPDPEHHFCTVVELELLYKSSTVGASLVLRRPIRSRTPPLRRRRCPSSRELWGSTVHLSLQATEVFANTQLDVFKEPLIQEETIPTLQSSSSPTWTCVSSIVLRLPGKPPPDCPKQLT